MMDLEARVQRAVDLYENLGAILVSDETAPDDLYLATPDRLAYALGWIVATEIVSARFLTAAIDAIPMYHPQHGWDRFLLTRRVSCERCSEEPANRFGMLMLTGDDAPRLTSPSGASRLNLGLRLRQDPRNAITELLDLIPAPDLPGGKHSRCLHERAEFYPWYFASVTEILLDHPGVVVSREIYIDDDEIDGTYHPLYLHAIPIKPQGPGDRHGMLMPSTVYDWFQLQYEEMFAFFDVLGDRAIYRTDRSTWSRVRRPLRAESQSDVRRRIEAWMRLSGAPDPSVD